jgi:hypothetical protein
MAPECQHDTARSEQCQTHSPPCRRCTRCSRWIAADGLPHDRPRSVTITSPTDAGTPASWPGGINHSSWTIGSHR